MLSSAVGVCRIACVLGGVAKTVVLKLLNIEINRANSITIKHMVFKMK